MTLEPGLRAAFHYAVTAADTAAAVGSGQVPVLATPRVLALAERATVAAVEGALEAGATTVGARVELDHLIPSPVGAELEVEAVLERVADRRLEFAVRLRDGDRPVASGRITRVVVDTATFLGNVGVRQPPGSVSAIPGPRRRWRCGGSSSSRASCRSPAPRTAGRRPAMPKRSPSRWRRQRSRHSIERRPRIEQPCAHGERQRAVTA